MRERSSASARLNPAQDLFELGSALFLEPWRIHQAAAIPFTRWFPARFHSHPDLLQLSLVLGCTGFWRTASDTITVRGPNATVFYPREPHGHELTPSSSNRPGEVLNIKIQVEPTWPAVRNRLFHSVTYQIRGELMLLRALRRLMRVSVIGQSPGPILIARVMEVLSLWPGPASQLLVPDSAATAAAAAEADLDRPMQSALTELERRINHPPALSELAEIAGFSPRHFARRFCQIMGVTPHEYLASRRLARAQEMLLQGDLTVSEVGDSLGFGSLSAFSRWFHQHTGVSPTDFQRSPKVS